MASSAKPKSAKPGNRAAPAAEPDPSILVGPVCCPQRWSKPVKNVQAHQFKDKLAADVAMLLIGHASCNELQLPADLPAECPFQVTWRPAVFAVQAADGFNLSTVKDAFKQLHVLSHITLSDLAARLDPADPLCAESAAAAAEGQQHALEGARSARYLLLLLRVSNAQFHCCLLILFASPASAPITIPQALNVVILLGPVLPCSVPIGMAAKLLQRQFHKDEALAWKLEIVRRRDQLVRLEAEAKVGLASRHRHESV
jgi:hypothetical protein